MKSADIHIGECYLVRSWMDGVRAVSGIEYASLGFIARWCYREMEVVSKHGRWITLKRTIIRAKSRDMETLKITWEKAEEISVVDSRNVIRKAESGNGLSQP